MPLTPEDLLAIRAIIREELMLRDDYRCGALADGELIKVRQADAHAWFHRLHGRALHDASPNLPAPAMGCIEAMEADNRAEKR